MADHERDPGPAPDAAERPSADPDYSRLETPVGPTGEASRDQAPPPDEQQGVQEGRRARSQDEHG